MGLLAELLKESASGGSTSAGAVAGTQGSGNLMGGGVMIMRHMGYVPVDEIVKRRTPKSLKEAMTMPGDSATKPYDYQTTLAKLDQAVKSAKEEKDDVAVFGLEDDEGKIIKVYVPREQGSKFEEALAALLADEDAVFTDDIEPKNTQEIAEILYKLKDEFDIVDVEWGPIEGDEEEEDELGMDDESGDTELADGEEGVGDDLGDEEGLGDELGGDGTEEQATTALMAVIDMMKAEAESKKAEAEKAKAEAEALIAQNASAAAQAKVRQEEEILSMEEHEKAQKQAKKEAETLARLAKYKSEMQSGGSDEEDFIPVDSARTIAQGTEAEESTAGVGSGVATGTRSMSKEALADLILRYARTNQR